MDLASFVLTDAINHNVDEALMLWYIKKIMKKCYFERKNYHEDEIWIPLIIWDMKFAFPFWTQKKIKEVLRSLVRQGVVKKKRIFAMRRESSYALAKQNYLD